MTAATAPAASAREMEVAYGYEGTDMKYGYSGEVQSSHEGNENPYEYGEEAEQSDSKHNANQPRQRRQRRLSAFVGAQDNSAIGGGGGGGNQDGGAGGGERKSRGRRLSLLAFAGQENDMEQFHHKKTESQVDANKDSKASTAEKPKRSMGIGLMRQLSSDELSAMSGVSGVSGHSNHGGGMLGSFLKGVGLGLGDDLNGGGANGPKKRRGRRLSMIAFDESDQMGSHDENHLPKAESKCRSGPLSNIRKALSEASLSSRNQPTGSSHVSRAESSTDGETTRKNRYYPPVQLPAEYLADASANKPITRTVTLGETVASSSHDSSTAQPHCQEQPWQHGTGGAPSRLHERPHLRLATAETTSTTKRALTVGLENPRAAVMNPEQASRKVPGRYQQSQVEIGPQLHGQEPSQSRSRFGNAQPSSQKQKLMGGLSKSHHGQITRSNGLPLTASSCHGCLDQSAAYSPAKQKSKVSGIDRREASAHNLESHVEGDVDDEGNLQQYLKSIDLEPSARSAHEGSVGSGSLNNSSGSLVSSSVGSYRKEIAAIAREARAAAMAGVEPCTNNMSLLYILARCCDWSAVLEEVQLCPRDAKVISEKDGTTALHLAVMSRTNPMMRDGKAGEAASLDVIEALVRACPEAAIVRCTKKRYTPLCYACLVADVNYDMEDCSRIIELLIKHAPHCPFVFTDDGFSALDIHILSYSQLHKHKEKSDSGARQSTVVLETLLNGDPSLADARVYRNKIRGPLELLYRCNIEEFKEVVDKHEELELNEDHDPEWIESVLSDWWAWKWTLMLLRFASISAGQDVSPFKAVHAAARLVGCPLPVLALSVNKFPKQVSERDPTGDVFNLPLHEVCSWRDDSENVAGDPFIATRKFKAMRMLLGQFPEAARMTNNCGETPLQLAIETCTPWHGGLEALVQACPKALKFPRKLRITDNGLSLAVVNHSAIDSVATNDSDEPDPLEPMENMYPFLVAAVLGGVSRNKRRPPVSFSDEMAKDHYANLKRKDLQAVRAVYGLLRARPEVLAKYRQFVSSPGV